MSIPSSILLLGAGELGSAILSRLAAQPALSETRFTVALRPSTVSDRDSPRLAALRSLVTGPDTRLSFASLDLGAADARETLTRIIRAAGAEVVVACTGFAGSGTGKGPHALIAQAVFESGVVKRYFPWQFGGDYDVLGPDACGGLMREQCAVRDVLRRKAEAAGVEWMIVSTGIFMSFVFEDWVGLVEGLGEGLKKGSLGEVGGKEKKVTVRGFGGWETGLTLTAVDDIGKVIADLVVNPLEKRNDKGGSVVYTCGQTVTYAELADVVEKVVGPGVQVAREEWSLESLTTELEKDPENALKKYRVWFAKSEGVRWSQEKTINAQRGIDTIGVEQWLRTALGV